MNPAIIERVIAMFAALAVAPVALTQLLNELPARGLDAQVTKFLLGLLVVGCLFAALGALGMHG